MLLNARDLFKIQHVIALELKDQIVKLKTEFAKLKKQASSLNDFTHSSISEYQPETVKDMTKVHLGIFNLF